MPFDAVTIAAVARELQATIVGGRVQGLVMPGPLTLALEVYRARVGRVHLIMSAHPQHARVHLSRDTPSRDPEQHPPLLLLLRKYLRGGIVTSVQQPPHERVLTVSIEKRFAPDKHQEYRSGWDFGKQQSGIEPPSEPDEEWIGDDETSTDSESHPSISIPVTSVQLSVEVMGRLSNIVLVDDQGMIMDAMKRIPPSLNRYRATLPHQPYVLPPPQDKRNPARVSPNALSVVMSEAALEDPDALAWKGLVSGLLGVSPTLAREAVFRAFNGDPVKADDIAGRPRELEQLLGALRLLLSDDISAEGATSAWRTSDEDVRKPIDYAPYQLNHLAGTGATIVSHPTISEAVKAYIAWASAEELGGHAALKGQVHSDLQAMLVREARRLRALREELARSRASETLRRKGETILAYMHTLGPGDTVLKVEEEALTIELDRNLSLVENAQAYFREYRKAQSAQAGLPEKLVEAQSAFDFWDGLITSLELAANYDEIRAVQAEMLLARKAHAKSHEPVQQTKKPGHKTRKGGQDKTPQPLKLRTHLGAHLLLGRTAGQNDTATFRLAAPDDLWLHARGAPGAHVILRAAGGYTDADLEEAASLAAGYSKLRNEQYVDVIVTERRNVRKLANAPPGTATYKHERVVRIRPAPPRAARD